MKKIPNTNCIQSFFLCAQCVAEKPDDQSPAEWARFNVGWTQLGLQIWCVRHDINVCHIDFAGHKFNANATAHSTNKN